MSTITPNDIAATRWYGQWAFWILLIAAAIFSFWELLPQGIRFEAVGPFVGLALGATVIAITGWAVSVSCGLEILGKSPALYIGIGQLTLVAWLYLRSVLSQAVEQIGAHALPVTRVELFLLVLVIIWRANRKKVSLNLGGGIAGMVWIFIALFLVSQRELSRELMLSSDPDQHLFFTFKIAQFGAVPFHLGSWGPNSFGYPAGFSALCAVWSWLGLAAPSNIVTVQPLVQTLVALLAIASFVTAALSSDKAPLRIVAGFLVVSLFFGFFPYTLTKEFFFLEKTGSISTLLVLITTVALSIRGGFGQRNRSTRPAFILAGAGVGLSALINPVAVIVPGIAFVMALAWLAWQMRSSIGKALRACTLYATVPALLVLADPYYLNRFVLRGADATVGAKIGSAGSQELIAEATTRMIEMIESSEWLRLFQLIPFFGSASRFALPVIGVAIAVFISLLVKEKRRKAVFFVALGPLLLVALDLTIVPVFHAIRTRGDFWLLEPYFISTLERLAYLWYFAVLMLALTQCILRVSLLRAGAVASITVFTIMMIPVRYARNAGHNDVLMHTRVDICSSYILGCLKKEDHAIFRVLAEQYSAYVSRGGSLAFGEIPKVLVPNVVLNINNEDWIMPLGGARLLPYVSTYPAAFYYGQGSADYSYDSYVAHVCRRLDVAWLRERNIMYLFIPADHSNMCVEGLERLIASGNVLAREGQAMLLRLY